MARKKPTFKSVLKGPLPYVMVGALVIVVGISLLTGGGFREITTQQGLELLRDSQVTKATIIDGDQRVDLELRSPMGNLGTRVQFYYVAPRGLEVVQAVTTSSVNEFTDEVPQTNWFVSLLGLMIPFIIIGLIFWFLLSSMQGGGSRVMQFGKSRAKLVAKETSQVTFEDVAGADEALEELNEIKEFLRDSEKFLKVGARIPKGVLYI
jgi:cell division protease FtsH